MLARVKIVGSVEDLDAFSPDLTVDCKQLRSSVGRSRNDSVFFSIGSSLAMLLQCTVGEKVVDFQATRYVSSWLFTLVSV